MHRTLDYFYPPVRPPHSFSDPASHPSAPEARYWHCSKSRPEGLAGTGRVPAVPNRTDHTTQENREVLRSPGLQKSWFFATCQVKFARFSREVLQLVLSDLNSKGLIALGGLGPQQQEPDRSGHYRTSTASTRSQCALPDLNSKRSHNTQQTQTTTNTQHTKESQRNTSTTKNTQHATTNTQPTKHSHKQNG